MSKEQTIAVWTNFVIASLKKKYNLSHSAFLQIMKKYKLIHFLVSNYELLHYYDSDYVVADTAKYIFEQGGKIA